MDDELRSPSILNVSAMEHICPTTREAWMWYCDEHDTHGTADSEEEADHMAAVHQEYKEELAHDAGEDAPEICEVIVWRRTSHERTKDWPDTHA